VWIINIWRFIQGYLCVVIRGRGSERLVNQAVIRGIRFWELKKSHREVSLKIPVKNFKHLRPLARHVGCRVRIREKRGLWFWWKRGRKRKGFLLGLLFFLVALYVASLFVWFIQVTGLENLEKNEVLRVAERAGLQTGVYQGRLDLEQVEKEIVLEFEEIAWVNVKLKGSLAEIEIVEHKIPEFPGDVPPQDGRADLVASKDGLVKDVLVLEGKAKVEPGETVSKGDVLIKGERVAEIPENEEEEPEKEQVFPRGEVEARVWYQEQVPIETQRVEKNITGERKTARYLKAGENIYRLQGPASSPYQNYKVEKTTRDWNRWIFRLPLELLTVTYHQVEVKRIDLSSRIALQEARGKARTKVEKQLPEEAEVVDKSWEKVKENDRDKIRCLAETIENIAEIRYYNDYKNNK